MVILPSIIYPSFYAIDYGIFLDDFWPKYHRGIPGMAHFLNVKICLYLGKVTNLLDILWCYFPRVDPKEISWPRVKTPQGIPDPVVFITI